jgi:hypothetical protein
MPVMRRLDAVVVLLLAAGALALAGSAIARPDGSPPGTQRLGEPVPSTDYLDLTFDPAISTGPDGHAIALVTQDGHAIVRRARPGHDSGLRAGCRWAATRARSRWRCARLRADGFALHPYTLRWRPDFPGPTADDVTTGSLGRIEHALHVLSARRVLATARGRPLPLYLTEWGWHARSPSVPEPLRSSYMLVGLDLIAADPHVRQVIWYQLVGAPDRPRPVWDTGLLNADGSPRPAFRALRSWARAAGGAD